MKNNWHITMFISISLLNSVTLYSQDSTKECKVELKSLIGTYSGECKNGFAHGKGEAKGVHRYVGNFKYGLPNGKGVYYYNNAVFYSGNFQEGLKEGKGETHYQRDGMPDSLVKGYWSADEYRGKSYKTYNITEMPAFERVDIVPSDESGNTLTIEISSTSGATRDQFSTPGNALTVTDVIAKDGSLIRKLETAESLFKFSTSYELSKFPVRLQGMFSNGRTFNLELYKKAKWRIQIYINK
ncbi:MAG: hypothetical protein ABI760_04310 [Ferruginibacter sp.]